MARETIQNIKDAELNAQQVLKDAEAEKAALLKKAREDGAAYKAELTGKAKGDVQQAVAAVEESLDAALVKAAVRAETAIKAFSGDMPKKRERAIQAVIDEIA